jgi:mannose-6-phosphate isomerase-like protein (cupin superfamily)
MKPEFKIIKVNKKGKYQVLLKERIETLGIRAGSVVLKPGESIGKHSTESKEEILVILKGKAEAFCDGSPPLTAEENYIVYIPPHTTHNVKNIGSGLLRYIYITSPIMDKE